MKKTLKHLLVFGIIGAFLAFSVFLLIDKIFFHRETLEHLSQCPFSGVIYGVTVSVIFLLLILLALILTITPNLYDLIPQQNNIYLPDLRAPPSI